MNKPSRVDFNIGTRAGVVTATGLAVAAIDLWGTQGGRHDDVPWIIPLATLFLVRAAVSAKTRVDAYRAWTEAWSEMGGEPGEQQSQAREPANRRTGRRRGLALALTGALSALWLSQTQSAAGTPLYSGIAGVFLLASAWGVGRTAMGLARGIRRRAPNARPTTTREQIVTLCMPIPRTCPGPREILAALPDHFRALLARRDAPEDSSPNDRQRQRNP